MSAVGFAGSLLVFVASFVLSFIVLAYRSRVFPSVRRTIDRWQRRATGRSDWSWLRLWHVMVPLILVTAGNIAWNVSSAHCSDDAFAILASGQAALGGHDPFSVTFCSHATSTVIPYGLAAVSLNAFGALSGTILGIWLVWQLLALAVVPLVWGIAGESRRYVSVLTATSVLYLPNIATNLGVENLVVAVSVLLMLYALGAVRRGGTLLRGVAAFLSTARFPALFPLLGSSASLGRRRWSQVVLVLGVFLGSAALAWALWGWDAIQVVYLGQFARANSESLNLFALLIHEGWVEPSLTLAAVQGAGLLAFVLFANVRGYAPAVSCAVPLIGVTIFSQYLNYHFVAWLIPLVLLGTTVNWWLFAYATLAAVNESFFYWYLALVRGWWWPYELSGILLLAISISILIVIVRDEEARLRSRTRTGGNTPRDSHPTPGDEPTAGPPGARKVTDAPL